MGILGETIISYKDIIKLTDLYLQPKNLTSYVNAPLPQITELMGVKDYKIWIPSIFVVKSVSSKLSLFSLNLYNFGVFLAKKNTYKTFNLKWIPSTFVVKPVSSKLFLFSTFGTEKERARWREWISQVCEPTHWTKLFKPKLANFVWNTKFVDICAQKYIVTTVGLRVLMQK